MKRVCKLVLGIGAALGLLAAINDRLRRSVGPTPRSVDGEQRFYQWREAYTRHGCSVRFSSPCHLFTVSPCQV